MSEPCPRCADSGSVCERHGDRPWSPASDAPNACDCSPGMDCPDCGERES